MSDPTPLPEGARRLLSEPVVATIATVDRDGYPHATPVWIDVDGDDVLFNTARGRRKATNLEGVDKVAVCAIDAKDPYRVVALQGRVVEVTDHGADEHIDALAQRYLGLDTYPMRQAGEERVIVRIRPERILMAPADPGEG